MRNLIEMLWQENLLMADNEETSHPSVSLSDAHESTVRYQ